MKPLASTSLHQALVEELFEVSALRFRLGCRDEFEGGLDGFGRGVEGSGYKISSLKDCRKLEIFDVFFLSGLDAQLFLHHLEAFLLVFSEIGQAFEQAFDEAGAWSRLA